MDLIALKNDKLEVTVTNLGCTIMKLVLIKKDGTRQDVVLGYDDVHEYLKYDGYLGAVVGRVANRIANGRFNLNDREYVLATNDGLNHLHGGIKGFSHRIFDYRMINDSTVEFTYLSKDGEEGYPGNLDLKVIYEIENAKFQIRYLAQGDQDTLVNLTNHSYFNLDTNIQEIGNHYLKIKANQFACIDRNGLPTGVNREVGESPFDFTRLCKIRDNLQIHDEQLELGHGFDHHFIFDAPENQVTLINSDRTLQLVVSTSLPGAQIYIANYLDGRSGKNNEYYRPRFGICIETQNMPDAIHLESNPTTILGKGQLYDEYTSYWFMEI